jgi:hypothetical protein
MLAVLCSLPHAAGASAPAVTTGKAAAGDGGGNYICTQCDNRVFVQGMSGAWCAIMLKGRLRLRAMQLPTTAMATTSVHSLTGHIIAQGMLRVQRVVCHYAAGAFASAGAAGDAAAGDGRGYYSCAS